MSNEGGEFSTALALLSELSKQKQIAPDKALFLKNAYVKLHTVCTQSQSHERELLESASTLNDEIKAKKEELEGQSQLHGQDRGLELRQELMKASNELAMSASRDMELQSEVSRLLEERRVLHDELMEIQQPAAVAADSEISRLKTDVVQAQQELAQRAAELELLKTQRDQRLKKVNEAMLQREQSERALEHVRADLVAVQGEPQRIAKQSDALFLAHSALKAKLDETEGQLRDLGREDEGAVRRRKETQMALEQLRLDIERARRELDSRQHDAQQHTAQIEMHRSTYADHIGQKALLEAELRRTRKDLKITYEQSMRLTREKDRGVKALRVLAANCDKLDSGVEATAAARHDLAMQLEARKREAADLAAIVPNVKRDVAELTKGLDTQGALGTETGRVVREGQEVQARLEGELLQAQKDLVDSSWRLRSVQTSLAQAQNEVVRAEANTERNRSVLALKQQALADCMAQLQQLQRSLADTDVVYNVVKTDNNKVSAQIAAVSQREAEMSEKIKVLQSEIEILRASVLEKDSKLSRQMTTNAVSVTTRDALRAEAGVVRLRADDLLAQKKGKFSDNKNLLDVLASVEETTTRLGREFAAVQSEKEELGERVHECQAELASLYDQLHTVASRGRTGDLALQAREEELRFLRVEATELRRAIEGLRARLPEKQKLEDNLLMARVDLLSEQKQSTRLEAALVDPSKAGRWRQLGGSDPTAEEMVKKIEDLERRLAQKEAIALERELVLGETVKLVDRAKKQVEGGRGDTATVAKAVQDYQARLRETNRKIMALIAEVSMYQANTLQLQQQVHERQLEAEEANERLQRGEAPTEEALHEWEREQRREQQAQMEAAKTAAEMEAAQAANLRPNAYLPDAEGELPIARPYGPYAPFKPSEPANNMRHIRKAMVRPVKT